MTLTTKNQLQIIPESTVHYYHNKNHTADHLDLFCPGTLTVLPGQTVEIDFGVRVKYNDSECLLLVSPKPVFYKSSLKQQNGFKNVNDTSVSVKVFNSDPLNKVIIKKGQVLFQLSPSTPSSFMVTILK